jgi:pimeloyl-ACP methyl ester carboxylesterase
LRRIGLALYAPARVFLQEEHMARHISYDTSMLRLLPALPAAVLWVVATSAPAGQQPQTPASPLQTIDVNGTTLHYVKRGSGEPVVFVHGSLGTYRTFQRPFETLSSSFHVVAFSRRFHPPNETPAPPQPYAMQEHVDDLVALVKALGIGPAHFIGHSYGAYVALAFALKHPELVRSLVLGEPPTFPLLQNSSVGKTLQEAFERQALGPSRAAFQGGNLEEGVRRFLDGVVGPGTFDRLPPEVRTRVVSSGAEMRLEVQTGASQYMVPLTCDALGRFDRPVLLVTGERSVPIFHVITLELERCLNGEAHVMVPEADHGLHLANPDFYTQAVQKFLKGAGSTGSRKSPQ